MRKEAINCPAAYLTKALDNYYQLPNSELMSHDAIDEIINMNNLPKKDSYHILLTTFWDYPHIGGLSNYLTSFKDSFEEKGHRVDIISPNLFEIKKVKTLRKQIKNKLRNFYNRRYGTVSLKVLETSCAMYSYEMLLREIDLNRYDIFHAQDIFTANILSLVNNQYKKPLYFTPHGTFTKSRLKFNKIQHGSVEEAFYSAIERRAINAAKKIIIISDSFRQPLLEFGAKNKQMVTIHTGINFPVIKKTQSNANEKIMISCVARLSPRKGHADLLKALVTLQANLNNVEVWIVGDGEMRAALEKLANDLRLTCVHFKGKREDIPQILSQSDLFVLPTINDNLPISIIEAMFAEQAIITTNCGGIPEVISHLKTGIIIEPGDTRDLAAKLYMLLVNRNLREALAINARKYAETSLKAETMVEKILNVYEFDES